LHVTINFIVVRGDTVIAQTTTTGTNSGPNMGMPATNKKINMDGVDIVIIKDGKATEHWGFFEEMKMMTQLGLMPGPNASTDSSMMNKAPMQKK
jgi:predicted ester cyclase